MGKINTEFSITDNMSNQINQMLNRINRLTASFDMLDTAIDSSMNASGMQAMNTSVDQLQSSMNHVATATNQVDMNMADATGQTSQLNNAMNRTSTATATAQQQTQILEYNIQSAVTDTGKLQQGMTSVNTAINMAESNTLGLRSNISLSTQAGQLLDQSVVDVANDMAMASRNTFELNATLGRTNTAMTQVERGAVDLAESIVTANKNIQRLNDSIEQSTRNANNVVSAMNRITPPINTNISRQNTFNNSLKTGNTELSGMVSKLGQMASIYLSLQSAGNLIQMSDTSASNTARIGNMMGNFEGDSYDIAGLEELVFAKAQDTGSRYNEMVSLVAKIGNNASDAFQSAEEVVAFADLLNKQFVNGGATRTETESALIQLTQALGAGRLQGEELNAILEAATGLVHNIADYMGVAFGEIKGLASEGLVTSDVITSAIFEAADDINEKFATMPNTWNQTWVRMKNQAVVALDSVLTKLSEIANTEEFNTLAISLANSFSFIADILVGVIDMSIQFGSAVAENWGTILPILTAVIGGLMVYKSIMFAIGITTIFIKIASAVWTALGVVIGIVKGVLQAFHIVNMMAKAGMTAKAIVVNILSSSFLTLGINIRSAMLSTLAIAGIFLVIAAIIGFVIYKIIEMSDTTLTAMGFICGAIAWAGAVIGNIVLTLVNFVISCVVEIWNVIAMFANFFATVFDNPVTAIAHLFTGLFDFVLGILQTIAKAIDTLFGSKFASAINSFRGTIKDFTTKLVGEQTIIMETKNAEDYTLERLDLGDAWDKGVDFGNNLNDWGANLFDTTNPWEKSDDFDYSKFLGMDNLADMSDLYDVPDMSGLTDTADNTGDTAVNTSDIADSISVSAEDLKFLKDMAERDTINRFTTASINVDMGGINNNVHNSNDIDGIVDSLVHQLQGAMEKVAEGAT